MSNELEQFKISYETLGMTPEDIAEDRGMDIAAVKAGLMQCSAKYRKDCGKVETADDILNFTDDDLVAVNKVIKEIALGAEDDNLRLKAAMYIRDDKKGRRDVQKAVGGMQFNILQFNQLMQQTRAGANELKKVVNV